MSIVGDIVAAVSTGGLSTIAGGLFGFVGSWLQKKQELEVLKLQYADKKSEREHEFQTMQYEASSEQELERIKGAIAKELAEERTKMVETSAEYSALEKSYSNDKRSWSNNVKLTGLWRNLGNFTLICVDVFRGIIRPAITTYAMFFLTYMFIKFQGSITKLTQDQIFQLLLCVMNASLFITTKSVVWWYGSRGKNISIKDISNGTAK